MKEKIILRRNKIPIRISLSLSYKDKDKVKDNVNND
jgi:hypothetical protein